MIMREVEVSITKRAKTLRISRGSSYYLPRPVSATDLEMPQAARRCANRVSQRSFRLPATSAIRRKETPDEAGRGGAASNPYCSPAASRSVLLSPSRAVRQPA
jgi:hypothetical protein